MRTTIFVILALLWCWSSVAADTGLEVEPGTKIYVLTEYLDGDEARSIGLTKDLITSKVELQLRRNGISVGTREEGLVSGVYLYVNVGVTGQAFAVSVEFKRKLVYPVDGKIYSVFATTYDQGSLGIYGSRGSNFILENLLKLIDIYSNDFLRANESR